MERLIGKVGKGRSARAGALASCLTLLFAPVFPLALSALTLSGCSGSGLANNIDLKQFEKIDFNAPAEPLPLSRTGAVGTWISAPTYVTIPVPEFGGFSRTEHQIVLTLALSSDGAMAGTLRGVAVPAQEPVHQGTLTGTCAEDGTYAGQVVYLGTSTSVEGRFEKVPDKDDHWLRMKSTAHESFSGYFALDRK